MTLGDTSYQVSTFNGTEPEPTKIDLPMGELNSQAVRVIQTFSPNLAAMTSVAYVKDPEGQHEIGTWPSMGNIGPSNDNCKFQQYPNKTNQPGSLV